MYVVCLSAALSELCVLEYAQCAWLRAWVALQLPNHVRVWGYDPVGMSVYVSWEWH